MGRQREEGRSEALEVWREEKTDMALDMALEDKEVRRMEVPLDEKEEKQQLAYVVDWHANRLGGREF